MSAIHYCQSPQLIAFAITDLAAPIMRNANVFQLIDCAARLGIRLERWDASSFDSFDERNAVRYVVADSSGYIELCNDETTATLAMRDSLRDTPHVRMFRVRRYHKHSYTVQDITACD